MKIYIKPTQYDMDDFLYSNYLVNYSKKTNL